MTPAQKNKARKWWGIAPYRLGFDGWGLAFFMALMLPNLIWFVFPAPNDRLRAESVTGALDAVMSACQAGMVAALCFVRRREREPLRPTLMLGAAAFCCIAYFVCWALYYSGLTHAALLLSLTLLPCFALLLFAIARKNGVAVVFVVLFAACHTIYAVRNFVLR